MRANNKVEKKSVLEKKNFPHIKRTEHFTTQRSNERVPTNRHHIYIIINNNNNNNTKSFACDDDDDDEEW